MEPAWDSLSLPLSASALLSLSQINKLYLLKKMFLMFIFERERENEWRRDRERETENRKQAPGCQCQDLPGA